jgi:ABC-type phosphate/phosphonate transport system substrate-binding protein
MGRGPIALIAVVIAAVLIVAGCGGSDDSSSASSISKEEFIAKADAVCQRGNKRMEKALVGFLTKNKKIQKPSQADNKKFIVTVLVPSLRQEIKEIKALGVPDGDEEKVDAMIAALEEGLETAEDDPEVVAAGTADIVFGIASRLAGEFGLETCGSR